MAFYQDVRAGDKFKPNAQLSNEVRHLINGLGNTGAIPGTFFRPQQTLSVPAALTGGTSSTFTPGHIVQLSLSTVAAPSEESTSMSYRLFIGSTYTAPSGSTESAAWGVLTEAPTVESQLCAVAISGLAWVVTDGSSSGGHKHVQPKAGTDIFEFSDTGYQVLYMSGTDALINLQGAGGGSTNTYNQDIYWAVQTGSGSPLGGLNVTLYPSPGSTASVMTGTAFSEPVNTDTTVSNAQFWVHTAELSELSYQGSDDSGE